ncbi:(+)-trans-carveol dehydrogenase [Rhodococcus rhodochrous J3]|jgi:SDR family mycofactocin-dependent oxidoreductase|uniref:(+)-trans-carveol dehydrogenase n=3 Tax=Rhodococcus rhodochrous TaxID=1829 RepID=A0A562ET52_RHORH|nr:MULTISPECIES: mycofactocin-coupled SDR family oxidoreductase [Rhodococcus]MBF4480217.1 mycofactocin-coupled SDR family oxidoreductase [Rhodococcus rhodochrous]MCB8910668.1 mycofactocin-coupled SDR family oxidoreductase [Rhodococcus rhodochrous]MDC3724295.1 mycofactocin-coupled SDR family oxidoreductase [Rhodococcus sp. Rp3]MDJ0399083.1 mycofactocin-coupled SDR family oxidoreductase [Rhodococcus rhodochrous]TWH25025.1 (+)-trans-carveol dehydrogenase [Rhodococcus rhodochrous J45]
MSGRVAGKVAFITGAARGQGRSHAIRLAEEGADIIALDIAGTIDSVERFYPSATEEDFAETVREVESRGRKIVARTADVRDFDAVAAVVQEGIAQFGRIDTVVANAGIFLFGEPTHLVAESDWDDVLDINLKGVWHTCKAVTPQLVEQGNGSIIITSSSAGIKGTPNVAPYTASKHAVVGLMRTLALELGPHGIRVNTVHPTGVATDMILNESCFRLFLPDEEHPTKEQAAPVFATTNAIPVPWVEPIDISNAVLFLASDEARYVTGTELKVDAGYTTR